MKKFEKIYKQLLNEQLYSSKVYHTNNDELIKEIYTNDGKYDLRYKSIIVLRDNNKELVSILSAEAFYRYLKLFNFEKQHTEYLLENKCQDPNEQFKWADSRIRYKTVYQITLDGEVPIKEEEYEELKNRWEKTYKIEANGGGYSIWGNWTFRGHLKGLRGVLIDAYNADSCFQQMLDAIQWDEENNYTKKLLKKLFPEYIEQIEQYER